MMKGTPGPWFQTTRNAGKVLIYAFPIPEFYSPLALVFEPRFFNREAVRHQHFNARLISAAPDMLEALKNIENDDEHMPSTAWKMIQDAIAKAERP